MSAREFDALEVMPAETRQVIGERAQLPIGEPDRWLHGWHLRGTMSSFRGEDDTPVPGALVAGELVVRDGPNVLREDIDYRVDEYWSSVTRLRDWPGEAQLDYRYQLLRIDAVVDLGAKGLTVVRGQSDLSHPLAPMVSEGRRVASAYVTGSGHTILPILEQQWRPITEPQPDALPRTTEVLAKRSRSLRVTFWGDSVTAGGSSSSAWSSFPRRFEYSMSRAGISAAVSVVAVGGSNTSQWLENVDSDRSLRRVAETAPDVVILEFVNDAELAPSQCIDNYEKIMQFCRDQQCDLILTTPHFVFPDWMEHKSITDTDTRAYVKFVRGFAALHGIAVADVSRSWERLWRFGIPYPALLSNGINHPDDRGHKIYAEEILAVFDVTLTTEAESKRSSHSRTMS